MCSPARLSSVWFPPDERTLATSLATAANDLGCTLGFLLGPYLVQDAGGMAVLLQLTLAMSVPPLAFACCRCFPAAPRVHTGGGGGGDGGGGGGGCGGGGGGGGDMARDVILGPEVPRSLGLRRALT